MPSCTLLPLGFQQMLAQCMNSRDKRLLVVIMYCTVKLFYHIPFAMLADGDWMRISEDRVHRALFSEFQYINN